MEKSFFTKMIFTSTKHTLYDAQRIYLALYTCVYSRAKWAVPQSHSHPSSKLPTRVRLGGRRLENFGSFGPLGGDYFSSPGLLGRWVAHEIGGPVVARLSFKKIKNKMCVQQNSCEGMKFCYCVNQPAEYLFLSSPCFLCTTIASTTGVAAAGGHHFNCLCCLATTTVGAILDHHPHQLPSQILLFCSQEERPKEEQVQPQTSWVLLSAPPIRSA